MKFKYKPFTALMFASLLSLFPLQTGLPVASAQSGTANLLSEGMSNSSVGVLQQNLQQLGYFQYPRITGYFGSVTLQAVENFQQAYSLDTDGIVGPKTQAALSHALVKQQIVADAFNYIGVPYQWGGSDPSSGFDCSGFVYYMFNSHGVTAVPRTSSSSLYTMGTAVDRTHLQPGDLVFFSISENGTVSHVGIYTGNGQFLSPLSSKGVYVQSLDNPYWSPRYLGAQRIY